MDLEYNHVLKQKANERYSIGAFNKKALAPDTIKLPFRDDFSGTKVWPDQKLWMDSNVYINDDFPVDPLSIGVATFDGADKFGKPYQSLVSKSYEVADYLTSKPINLREKDNVPYTPKDSIYLSFYYQPQGFGNSPESSDSLILEFKTNPSMPEDTLWSYVWSVEGSVVHPFKNVMIPITDTAYFKKGFQFRFKNYTSFSGGLDHWHLDYVRLEAGRTKDDTKIEEVTWIERTPSSLLKFYQSMPWRHFLGKESSQLKTDLSMRVRNNGNTSFTTFYRLDVQDENNNVTGFFPGPVLGSKSALTPDAGALTNINGVSFPSTIFPDNGKDSAVFKLEKIMLNSDIFPRNDTLVNKQEFYNHYAYDDGTSEAGYGIREFGGRLAATFNVLKPDTLRAISVFFNQMGIDVSQLTFKLTVWDNISTNHIIYQGPDVTPVYENSVNGYHVYKLDNQLIVSGTIYVGLVQNTKELINLGVDLNTSNNQKNYFLPSTQTWYSSTLPGAWMIRPVFGKELPLILSDNERMRPGHKTFSIYPNPASDRLYINSVTDLAQGVENIKAVLTDAMGRIVIYENIYSSGSMDISGVPAGLYFIKVSDGEQKYQVIQKIVITK